MPEKLRIDIREDDSGLYFEYSWLDAESGGHLAKYRPLKEPDWTGVHTRIKGIFDLAFRNNSAWLSALQEWGQQAFIDYIPEDIRKELQNLETGCITWALCSARAASFPWELCHDGRDFLVLRHICGRLLQGYKREGTAAPNRNNRILILSDPAGDLPEAYREGEGLCRFLEQNTGFTAQGHRYYTEPQLLTRAGRETVIEELQKHEIVHYCGHSCFTGRNRDSGWKLSGGEFLNLADIRELARYPFVPHLIFSNSCSSGEQSLQAEEALSGIAGAFLAAGVSGYIGTVCPAEDQAAYEFASRFYITLGNGRGHASNLHLVQKETHMENPVWAIYRYYGDPVQRASKDTDEKKPPSRFLEPDTRSDKVQGTGKKKPIILTVLILLALAVMLLGLWYHKKRTSDRYKQNFIYIEGKERPIHEDKSNQP